MYHNFDSKVSTLKNIEINVRRFKTEIKAVDKENSLYSFRNFVLLGFH